MAIFRCEARVIGRSDRAGGRSVVACAAYRSGTRLHDQKYDYTADYSRRQAGVVFSEILAPENAPAWASDREKLWNEVERKEDESNRRKSAQLAREFILAIPHELSPEQRKELVLDFAKKELVARGIVTDISLHEPKEGKNVHAHILCTMREIGPEGFGKKARQWNDTAVLLSWRKAWETECNTALESAGEDARVDCRSLADQGIDREPAPKIGVAAAAMERKGIQTERGLLAAWHAFENRIRSAIRGIKFGGEVAQQGTGETWWEKAQAALSYTVETVRGYLHEESVSWKSAENQRRESQEHEEERMSPDMGLG